MEISTLPYLYQSRDLFSMLMVPKSFSEQSLPPKGDSVAISSQAQSLSSSQIHGLQSHRNQISFSFISPDKSNALIIKRALSLQTNTETVQINLSFLSEKLNPINIATDPQKSISIRVVLHIHREQSTLNYQAVLKKIQTTRSPEEILLDLMEGLREVINKHGNNIVSIMMDEEAIKSLSGDEKFRKAFQELLTLIKLISMQHASEGRAFSVIKLSGKGKPYLQYQEEINFEQNHQDFEIEIIVSPSSNLKQSLDKGNTPIERELTWV
ncbi:MAG: hypothetical protein ACPL4H_07225 [Anaerolineales bacterium]